MALFGRSAANLISVVNHPCFRFTTSAVRLKGTVRKTAYPNVRQEPRKQNVYSEAGKLNSTFENMMQQRKVQANKSILVQVQSVDSCSELYSYCSQFGSIANMYHYTVKDENFVLVEFRQKICMDEILSDATFLEKDSILPLRTSMLWFRKAGKTSSNHVVSQLSWKVEDSNIKVDEEAISHNLYYSQTVTEQIKEFYNLLRLSEVEIRLRFYMITQLEQTFSGFFPNVVIQPFGSSVNGFGSHKCDLDITLIPGGNKNNNPLSRLVFQSKTCNLQERNTIKNLIHSLGDVLHEFVPGIVNVRKISEARVPIIKFYHRYADIECDLSLSMTAIHMSELLYLYGELDWRVRPLVFLVRQWAVTQSLTNSKTPGRWITNFSLSLLVIFYLQQKHILPSLSKLKSYATHEDIRYTNVDCTFPRDIRKFPVSKPNKETLDMLLYGFFKYYSNFNFNEQGISLREGCVLGKPDNSALYIYNPLEPTLNVSKNVNSYEVNRLSCSIVNAVDMFESQNFTTGKKWGIMKLLDIQPPKNPIESINVTDKMAQIKERIEEDKKRKEKFISISEVFTKTSEEDKNLKLDISEIFSNKDAKSSTANPVEEENQNKIKQS